MIYQELVALVAAPIAAQLAQGYTFRDDKVVAARALALAREVVDHADRLTRPEDEASHD